MVGPVFILLTNFMLIALEGKVKFLESPKRAK